MLQTRSLFETVTSAFLLATLSHAALLPTSLNISIQSENMRHILKWSSLQETCFSINYTVRYQGEFEYMQNARWQDEPLCIDIVKTECDLTAALSSDSDYNISVLARCDHATLWTQLPNSFNRRDTVLLAPKMDVQQRGSQIEVLFDERQNHININLKIWKEGDEQNALIREITGQRFHYDVWQEGECGGGEERRRGGIYCVKAEAVLDLNNKRNSTDKCCIQVQDPEPPWLIPVTSGVAVTFSLVLALILGLMTRRCSLWLRNLIPKKGPLPTVLLDWTKPTILISTEPEELTHTVSLLAPSQEPDRTLEVKEACDEETSPHG